MTITLSIPREKHAKLMAELDKLPHVEKSGDSYLIHDPDGTELSCTATGDTIVASVLKNPKDVSEENIRSLLSVQIRMLLEE